MVFLPLALIKSIPFVFGAPCPGTTFFFLPPWWKYLEGKTVNGQCSPVFTDAAGKFDGTSILAIGLAVIDMLTRLAGLVAVVVVIMAGIAYITAQGNAEKATSARRRIYQGFIGLAIVFVAAGVVAFIGNRLNP